MNSAYMAGAIFALAYLFFIFLPHRRTLVAIMAAFALIVFRVMTFQDAFWAVNWNVMGIFVGTLFVANAFMESRLPAYLAEIIVNRSKNTAISILLICAMTGFISAFVENVATVLIVAPIALSLAKKLNMNPVKMLIAIAVSSNLQGTATLIGDPPSMLLGGYAGMNFMDFFFYQGRMSIFFAVQAGALVSFIVLYYIFRDQKKRVKLEVSEQVRSWVPTVILVVLIVSLALSSFLDRGFSYMAGILCMVFGLACAVWELIVYQKCFFKNIKSLDWETTFFLAGVFVLVGGVTQTGWIDAISGVLFHWVGTNVFLAYTLIVFVSVFASAFVDNVPFLAAMLPVAVSMSDKLHINPSLLLFGLLIGASLGGNITPIGASANIVACGLLKKHGHAVSFKEFFKIGFPFTLAAVFAAYIFVWVVWGR